jgi:hypothetical protein
MRKSIGASAAFVLALVAAPAWAQIGVGGGCGDTSLDPCYVEDQPTEASVADIDTQTTAIAQDEEQELLPGLAGGFDVSQALSGDLEQQVSSAGGLPLIIDELAAYPNYWPGYTNANYEQGPPPPGSPEANTALTLGTLWGALNAGADQQASQQAENARLTDLENQAASASGNLQVQEVSNEIALFNGQEEMKQRNATNGTLNALLVAESNRQNQKAQDDLESLAVATAVVKDDFANNPDPQEPPVPTPGE